MLLSTFVQVLLSLLQQEILAVASSSAFHTLIQPWGMQHGSNSLNGHMGFAADVTCAQRRCSKRSNSELQGHIRTEFGF